MLSRVLINTSIGFRFRIYTDQAFSFQMTLWNDCDKNDQMRYDLKRSVEFGLSF